MLSKIKLKGRQQCIGYLLSLCLSLVGSASLAAEALGRTEVSSGLAYTLDANGRRSELPYRVSRDGYAVYQDIILGKHSEIQQRGRQVSLNVATPNKTVGGRIKRALLYGQATLWPNNRIPYTFKNATPETVRVMHDAFDDFHKDTNVRFVEKTAQDNNFVEITTSSRKADSILNGASFIGKQRNDGRQMLYLVGGAEDKKLAAHELMHALGFLHENVRPDRDAHIALPTEIIKWLKEQWGLNFVGLSDEEVYEKDSPKQPFPSGTPSWPFDFDSIMFLGNVIRLDGGFLIYPFATASKLSNTDIKKVNYFYPPLPLPAEPELVPSRLALQGGESRIVTVRAPCEAKLTFAPLSEVEVSPAICTEGPGVEARHVFRVTARKPIRYTDRFLNITVANPRTNRATPLQLSLTHVSAIFYDNGGYSTPFTKPLNLLEGQSLTLTVHADCRATIVVGKTRRGLTWSTPTCQNNQHRFSVVPNGVSKQTSVVAPITVQHREHDRIVYEEKLYPKINFFPTGTTEHLVILGEELGKDKRSLVSLSDRTSCLEAIPFNPLKSEYTGTEHLGSVIKKMCVSPISDKQQWFYRRGVKKISSAAYPDYCLVKASEQSTGERSPERSSAVALERCNHNDATQNWVWDSQEKTFSYAANPTLVLGLKEGKVMVASRADFTSAGQSKNTYRWGRRRAKAE